MSGWEWFGFGFTVSFIATFCITTYVCAFISEWRRRR